MNFESCPTIVFWPYTILEVFRTLSEKMDMNDFVLGRWFWLNESVVKHTKNLITEKLKKEERNTLKSKFSSVYNPFSDWSTPFCEESMLYYLCWFYVPLLKTLAILSGPRCWRGLCVHKGCFLQETWCLNATISDLLCSRGWRSKQVRTAGCWSWRSRSIYGGRLGRSWIWNDHFEELGFWVPPNRLWWL